MKFIRSRRLAISTILASILFLMTALPGGSSQNQGSPPEITFDIDFPSQISADGERVQSFVFFKDPDEDIAKISFGLTKPHEAAPLGFDPQVKGKLSGVIKLTIAATSPPLELEICVGEPESCEKIHVSDSAPAEVTLSVTLADEAGNVSEPKEFSFEVVAVEAGPILQVSPTSLSFQGQEGGSNPDAQALQIINEGGDTLSWSASTNQSWISLNPMKGTAPSTVTVSVDIAGLEAGSRQGRITITAPGAQNSPTIVPVALTILPKRGNPSIIRVDFPQQIPADGTRVTGKVYFEDPEGDINKITFEVVEATEFKPFSFNPYVQGQTTGAIGFFIACYTAQQVTLRVMLFDGEGNRSEPVDFSFSCRRS